MNASYNFTMQLLHIYRIHGNFRGMKFSLNGKQTGFSRLYFCGSQVHRGKVACCVLLQISNCCKIAIFHALNFRCISSDREICKIYISQKFPRVRYKPVSTSYSMWLTSQLANKKVVNACTHHKSVFFINR